MSTSEAAAQAAQSATQNGTTALVTAPEAPKPAPPTDDPSLSGSISAFASSGNFVTAQRIAKALAASTVVPKAYQGNVENCLIALDMASRIGATPLAVMQNLHVINGNPGWAAKFLVATVNTSRRFSPIRYRFVGTEGQDDWGCRAVAREENGEELVGPMVTIKMAKAEGWYDKPGSKWLTMPEVMLMYRSASFWVKVYAPEMSLGMGTSEELEDMAAGPLEVGPKLADIPHADAANSGRRMPLGTRKPMPDGGYPNPAVAPTAEAETVATPETVVAEPVVEEKKVTATAKKEQPAEKKVTVVIEGEQVGLPGTES